MGTLVLRLVEDVKEFEALRDSWNDVLDTGPDKNVYWTWEWQFTWWKHYGQGRKLNILVMEDDGRIVAIAPFSRIRLGFGILGLEVLQNIGNNVYGYGGILIGERGEEALALLSSYIETQCTKKNTVVEFSNLPEDSRLLSFFRHSSSVQKTLELCERPMDVATHHAATQRDPVNMPREYDLRRLFKRLNENYEIGFDYHVNGNLSEAIGTLLNFQRVRLASKGKKMLDAWSSARGTAFAMDAVNALNRRGLVRMSLLTADGNPISAVLGFEYGGRFEYVKPGFNPDYAKYSPGHMHIFHLLRESISRGVTEFDFGRGEADYKNLWSTGKKRILDVALVKRGPSGKLRLGLLRLLQKQRNRWRRRTRSLFKVILAAKKLVLLRWG